MTELYWTLESVADRNTIYEYIEADNPIAALELDELLSEKANYLITYLALGRIGKVKGTRELVVHQNYILIYDITDKLVCILRVLHAAKRWP